MATSNDHTLRCWLLNTILLQQKEPKIFGEMVILEFGQRKDKTSPEHFVVPKNKEILKN
jgi:hypothetical protein